MRVSKSSLLIYLLNPFNPAARDRLMYGRIDAAAAERLSRHHLNAVRPNSMDDDESFDDQPTHAGWKACDPCFRGKIKCTGDGTHPCPTCKKKGVTCVYLAPKKRGPKTGALRALQEEVDLLRAQLAETTRGKGTRGAPAPAPAALPARSQQPSMALEAPPLVARLAPLELEVRFVRVFFMYCNTLLPMICKQVRSCVVGGHVCQCGQRQPHPCPPRRSSTAPRCTWGSSTSSAWSARTRCPSATTRAGTAAR